jgi:hypothetical protein
MKCSNCYFTSLFHCAHPKRYIQPFLEDCDLYKEGDEIVSFDNTIVCNECGNKVNVDDAKVFGKGSRIICNECLK